MSQRPHFYGNLVLANYHNLILKCFLAIEYKIIYKDKVTMKVRALTHSQARICSINRVNTV